MPRLPTAVTNMPGIETTSGYTQKIARFRYDRWIMLLLMLCIVSGCIIYMYLAMNSANEIRTRYALNRNRALALLGARLLNERWNDTVETLTALTGDSTLESALRRRNRPMLDRQLRKAMNAHSGLVFAAAYGPEGRLIADCPVNSALPLNASRTDWFQKVISNRSVESSDLLHLGDRQAEAMVIARAIGSRRSPLGYLLMGYRMDGVDDSLRQMNISDGVFYIVNTQGTVLDSSAAPRSRQPGFADHPALRLALQRHHGSMMVEDTEGAGTEIIGYALADRPRWIVLVVQSRGLALAATDYLAWRFSLLALILLFLLFGTLWGLDKLNRRQHRLALLLVEQNRHLRAADRAKSDFLANVSHDLRTPIANMQIAISGLLEPNVAWQPEQVQQCLRLASAELDQLTARVRNLLEMTRLEANAWPLSQELCDLTDCVGAALERTERLRSDRPIYADFPEEPLLVECDPTQIETVLINLLENAIKYSPPGTPLHLRGEACEGFAVCRVRDEGPGIDPAETERIFAKFYRTSTGQTRQGTGLGLAICKAIIEQHGGTIGVRNVPGSGAEFWFSLPLQMPSPQEAFRA
ncbi:MAG TPA: ATP-binding protein [Chthonomonadaceae bacterium]|nr:ATP-binding protein [Chthonomonadaceae bacterium]